MRRKPGCRSVSTICIFHHEGGINREGAAGGERDREAVAEGLITNGERYNKVIDIWAHVSEQVAIEMMKEISEGGDRAKDGIVESYFYDGGFWRSWKFAADSTVGWNAWIDGQAIR